MLMGQLPGRQALPLTNSYAGAQRFASAPLQPYPLPQPVPRPPVMPQPPAPVAALPAAIEAWRSQILAMSPWQLMQQFGMPAGQVRQLLADPQTAISLFQSVVGRNSGLQRVAGGGNTEAGTRSREMDKYGRGTADLSLGNIGKALGFGANVMGPGGLVSLGAQLAANAAGIAGNPLPEFSGFVGPSVIGWRELRAGVPLNEVQRRDRERAAKANRGLGSGGWGRPGATEARDIGGGGSRSGSASPGSDRGSRSGRSSSTTDRNDR